MAKYHPARSEMSQSHTPEAVDNQHGLESPSMEVAVDVRHYAILELHASDDEEEVL